MLRFLMRLFRHRHWHGLRSFTGLSVVLYLVFGLLTPLLLASQDEAAVPACCRRAGLHHCAVVLATRSKTPGVSSGQHCSEWPQMFAASHAPLFAMPNTQQQPAGLAPQDSVVTRNAEARRIARERQLALRGPPGDSIA